MWLWLWDNTTRKKIVVVWSARPHEDPVWSWSLRFFHFLVRCSLVYPPLYYKKVNLTSFWKSGRMTRHFGTYCFISHQQPNAVITFDCLVFTTTTIREEEVGERFTMYHDASSSKMNDKQCGTCSALFSKDFFQIMAPFVLYSR